MTQKAPPRPNAREIPGVVRSDRGKDLSLVWAQGHLNFLKFLNHHPAPVFSVRQIYHIGALEKVYKLHIGIEIVNGQKITTEELCLSKDYRQLVKQKGDGSNSFRHLYHRPPLGLGLSGSFYPSQSN